MTHFNLTALREAGVPFDNLNNIRVVSMTVYTALADSKVRCVWWDDRGVGGRLLVRDDSLEFQSSDARFPARWFLHRTAWNRLRVPSTIDCIVDVDLLDLLD